MICNKCGKQNNDSSKFCVSCGNTLQNGTQNMVNNLSIEGETSNFIVNNSASLINGVESSNPAPVVSQVGVNQSMPVVNQSIVNENRIGMEQQKVVTSEPIMNSDSIKKEKKSFKLNKKILFIIGGAVIAVIIIVIVLAIMSGGSKDTKDVASLFDLNQVIPVRKDGGYVYIDPSGKMPKNIKYNTANDFNGDFTYVELDDGTSALIDKNQNIKVRATSYYAIKHIEETESWLIDGVLYDKKLKAISDKSLQLYEADDGYFKYNSIDLTQYGIINPEGKVVYKTDSLIYRLEVTDDEQFGIIVLQKGTEYKEYLIDLKDGTVIYENQYKDPKNSYSNSINESSNGIFYINDDNYDRAETFYVKDKKIVYSIKGDIYNVKLYGDNYIKLDYGYLYEDAGKEQQYYYYDIKNKKLLTEEPKLEEIDIDIKEEIDITQRQIVSCDNGYGLIDDKKVIIPCMYDDIDYLPENVHEYMIQKESKDLMYVENNDKIFIYDANSKKEYIKFEDGDSYDIVDSSNSLFVVQKIYVDDKNSWSDKLQKIVVYNLLTKQKIEFDATSEITIKTNYFKETKNGKTIYYNMNFEKIYTEA